MSIMPHSIELDAKIMARYRNVADDIKEDLLLALEWARITLTQAKGYSAADPWLFNVLPFSETAVVCELHRPSWSGSHVSEPMETGPQAVVVAVCEYLEGA